MQPRKAFLLASLSRYVTIVLQAVAMLTVAHHLPPALFGVTVLGSGVVALAGAVRELGSTSYLVQQRELNLEQIRSAATVALLITLAVAALLLVGAGSIATFYRDDRLVPFVQLLALGYTLDAFYNPVAALLTREMAFGRLALLEVIPTAVSATVAIVLVTNGGGYLSVAWAALAQSVMSTGLAFGLHRGVTLLRPSLRHWRTVLAFGFHGGATAIVYRLGETVTFLLLGRVLDSAAVGLVQRSYVITQIPERVLLAGVGAVALPSFARLSREDRPLSPAYLQTVALVTPVYVAAVLALIPLARAAVLVLLGPAWISAIPLVQIMAAGHLVGIAGPLNVMVLIGSGHLRATTPLAAIQIAILLVCILVAAPLGVDAVAWTAFVTVPLNTIISFWFVKRHVPFAWGDLWASIGPGLIAAAFGGMGAAIIPLFTDWSTRLPVVALVGGVALGGGAWLVALRMTRHRLFDELTHTLAAGLRRLRRRPATEPT